MKTLNTLVILSVFFTVVAYDQECSASQWDDIYFDNPPIAEAEYRDNWYTPDIEIWLGEKIGRFITSEFRVQGGMPTYPTPSGSFWIYWKNREHISKQWDAPMPYAMFFKDGAALHVGPLYGGSHGCVRISEEMAKVLFAKCYENRTRVVVYP